MVADEIFRRMGRMEEGRVGYGCVQYISYGCRVQSDE